MRHTEIFRILVDNKIDEWKLKFFELILISSKEQRELFRTIKEFRELIIIVEHYLETGKVIGEESINELNKIFE